MPALAEQSHRRGLDDQHLQLVRVENVLNSFRFRALTESHPFIKMFQNRSHRMPRGRHVSLPSTLRLCARPSLR